MRSQFTIRAEFAIGNHQGGSANPANTSVEQEVFVSAFTEGEALAEVAACEQTQRIYSIDGREISREESNQLLKR